MAIIMHAREPSGAEINKFVEGVKFSFSFHYF